MNILITQIAILFLLIGCATPQKLSDKGRNIYIVGTDSSFLAKCNLIGQVRVDNINVSGMRNYKEQIMQIKNSLRNETANKYKNADTVAYSDYERDNLQSKGQVNALGMAFECLK